MGLNNFILTCEKDNEELRKGINYYKNMTSRLKKENQELEKQNNNFKTSLDESQEIIIDYIKEIEKLKKQLEEKEKLIEQCDLSVSNMMNCYCERTDCSGRIKDSKVYDSLVQKVENQQQEFIKWLEDEIKLYNKDIQTFSKDYNVYFSLINDLKVGKTKTEEILQKYKEIIGDDK